MSRARKLLNKINKNKNKIQKNYSELIQLQDNPNVYDVIADIKERKQRPRQKEEITEKREIKGFTADAVILERVDFQFPNEDYGLELTVPPGIITTSRIGSGDEVEFIGGILDGRSLEVIRILNSTTLRLDDVSTFSSQETSIQVKFVLNKE